MATFGNLFGFFFKKKAQQEKKRDDVRSFVPPALEDGSLTVDLSAAYGTYLDIEGVVRNEFELINRYKEMAMFPECDSAIDDIVNEAIVGNEDKPAVSIILDEIPGVGKSIKDDIRDEFEEILRLLDFSNACYDIFRRWYVDGRLYFHKIIDEDNEKEGIVELRYIDPRQIRKIRQIRRKKDTEQDSQVDLIDDIEEFYLYNPRGVQTSNVHVGTRIHKDAICYVHSGLLDKRNMMVLSHLNKAIKPLNQLRMIEDAMVIYRLSRAPERRIFYIDVGNLPKTKAEQYLKSIMNQYRNKLVYDANTGEIRDDRRHMSMMEDIWLPRREGSQGTSIDTLKGAENLSEIEDVLYFQKKLYKSLNVPITRLDSETGFSLGRATEITRDELKFTKFISRLRKRFTHLFDDLLSTQLICKGICTRDEWDEIKEHINYDFLSDSYFSELKEAEVLRDRLAQLQLIQPFEGVYYSREWIRTNVLKQTEDDIEEIDEQIEDEKAKYSDEMEENPLAAGHYPGLPQAGNFAQAQMKQQFSGPPKKKPGSGKDGSSPKQPKEDLNKPPSKASPEKKEQKNETKKK